MRPCLEPGCPLLTPTTRCSIHQRERNSQRNADPRRRARYGGDWPERRRAAIEAQPWCSVKGCRDADLTVDHDPDGVSLHVLCRSHHARLEALRRAGRPPGSLAGVW